MRKTLSMALVFAFVLMVAGVASAAPLTDFRAGHGTVDLMFQSSPVSETTPGWTIDYPKKTNTQYGLTVGLGNELAFQYRNGNVKSGAYFPYNPGPDGKYDYNNDGTKEDINGSAVYEKMSVNEFNVLHKFNPNLIGFVGLLNAKGEFINMTHSYGISETKNILQFGLTGILPLGPKTNAFATVAFGKDMSAYEIGLSQEIAKNLDLNVGYREMKLKGWTSSRSIDEKLHGFEFGLTYHF